MSSSTVDYAVVSYLESKLEANPSLASAIATIQEALGVGSSPDDFNNLGYFPTTLDKIFDAGVAQLDCKCAGDSILAVANDPKFESFSDAVKKKGFYKGVEEGSVEYLQRQAKLVAKFVEKSKAAAPDTAGDEARAEECKGLGNAAVTAKDFAGAIEHYTKAIDLSPAGPNSHVYYSNRAAAHCHTSDYKSAINDCETSIAIEPTYVKALARLGLANYFEGNYEASISAYEKAVTIEPGNKSSQDALTKAKAKLRKQNAVAATSSTGGMGGAGGMPDMSALAGMMGGMGGGGGGMGDMLKNPAMMGMAQKMMQNPAMMAKAQEMMKDPNAMQQAMKMMGGAGGAGGGGMPDMSALAGMMGDMGGAGGAPSSSGAKSD